MKEFVFCCVFLIFIINMYGLFFWKIKKGTTTNNAFQRFLNKSSHKPNEIGVHKNSETYSRSMKSWLEDNGI